MSKINNKSFKEKDVVYICRGDQKIDAGVISSVRSAYVTVNDYRYSPASGKYSATQSTAVDAKLMKDTVIQIIPDSDFQVNGQTSKKVSIQISPNMRKDLFSSILLNGIKNIPDSATITSVNGNEIEFSYDNKESIDDVRQRIQKGEQVKTDNIDFDDLEKDIRRTALLRELASLEKQEDE